MIITLAAIEMTKFTKLVEAHTSLEWRGMEVMVDGDICAAFMTECDGKTASFEVDPDAMDMIMPLFIEACQLD